MLALFIISLTTQTPQDCSLASISYSDYYDSIRITCSERTFSLSANETEFDTISGFALQADSMVIQPYYIKLTNSENCSFLLTMEKPDYNGPTINLININQSEPKQILSIQRIPIEIFTSKKGETFIVLQKLSGDPGYWQGYTISEIPLFELYELNGESTIINEKATDSYNRANFEGYSIISKMKNPAYGFKDGKREILDF